MTSELEIAWAAGFFDGEGSVSIRRVVRPGKLYYGLYLRASQVEREPLDKLVAIFNTGAVGKVRAADAKRAPYHDWACAGVSAGLVLARMLPYLTVKRERALLGLDFQQRVRRGRFPLSPEELEFRRGVFERMRFLNLRQVPRTAAETKSKGALVRVS